MHTVLSTSVPPILLVVNYSPFFIFSKLKGNNCILFQFAIPCFLDRHICVKLFTGHLYFFCKSYLQAFICFTVGVLVVFLLFSKTFFV